MARMLFHTVAAASLQVAGIRSRTRKIAVLADILRQAGPDEVEIAATYLGGSLRQRRTGVGWRSLRELPEPAAVPSLTVGDVDAALQRLADLSGAGSQALRVEGVRALFGSATIEPRWVVGFEVVLGAHLPPSMAARSPVSMVSVSMVMDSSER